MPDKVLVTRKVPSAGLRLLEGFDVAVLSEGPPAREELLEAARGAAGILSTVTENVDAELMDAAGEDLEVVANMAVGYDNVDVDAATERGVVVTNTPEVLNETTADTAFMLLLAAARRLGESERLLRSGGVGCLGTDAAHGSRRLGQEARGRRVRQDRTGRGPPRPGVRHGGPVSRPVQERKRRERDRGAVPRARRAPPNRGLHLHPHPAHARNHAPDRSGGT